MLDPGEDDAADDIVLDDDGELRGEDVCDDDVDGCRELCFCWVCCGLVEPLALVPEFVRER